MRKEEARTVLGVSKGDDETVIKKAYRKLALKNHPDKNKGSEESKKKFQQISEAFKCLTDPNYEDELEGFADINEEEMFEMFNEMFMTMVGGSMMNAMFGGSSDEESGFLPTSSAGGILDFDDLSEEDALKAEAFIENDDEAGFMRFMNKLQREKDEEAKQKAGNTGCKKTKSKSSSSRRGQKGGARGMPEEMMMGMMMDDMMGQNFDDNDEDEVAAMASMMFGGGGRREEHNPTYGPIDSDEEEILADLMSGMAGMGLGQRQTSRNSRKVGNGRRGFGSNDMEEAMMEAFMKDMLQSGSLDHYDDEDLQGDFFDKPSPFDQRGRRRKVKVKSKSRRQRRAPPTSVAEDTMKKTSDEGLD